MTYTSTVDPFHRAMLDALPTLRRAAYGLTRSVTDTDDLVQATIVKALEGRDQFTVGSNMAAWLCVICRHAFLSQRRQAWRVLELSDQDMGRLTVEPDQLPRLYLADVLRAMAAMRPDQCTLLELAATGHSQGDIARLRGIKAGTIKSRTHRARAELARRLEGRA